MDTKKSLKKSFKTYVFYIAVCIMYAWQGNGVAGGKNILCIK